NWRKWRPKYLNLRFGTTDDVIVDIQPDSSAMKNPVRSPSHFDWIVRWLSVASLAATLITSAMYFMSLRGRGVGFMSHILLGVMLVGQFVIFLLGIIVAALLTARRGQFGLAWFTSALFSM